MFDFGENLRQLRKKQGLTQEQVAEQLGISSMSVSRWEGNGITLPLKRLLQLSQLYHVPISSLMGMEQKEAILMDDLTKEQQNIIKTLLREFRKEDRKKGVSTYANEKN